MELNKELIGRYWSKPEVKDFILSILGNIYEERSHIARAMVVSLIEGLESKDELKRSK